MRNGTTGGNAATLQREVLPSRHAFHSVRSGNRVHVTLGCRLQGNGRREQADPLEHAQLHHHSHGWVRLCPQEGGVGLEKIALRSLVIPKAVAIIAGFQLACQPVSA